MKKYSQNDLLALIDNFDSLNIEVQRTMGEILYEMYQNDIIVPLNFYSDKNTRSSIGIVMAHLYKDKYSDIDFEQFLKNLNSTKPLDLNRNINKTHQHFIDEFIDVPTASIVEDELFNPITVNDYFNLIDRALQIFNLENGVLNKHTTLENIKEMLESTNIYSLLNYSNNDLNRLKSIFLSIEEANKEYKFDYLKISFPSLNKIVDVIVEMHLKENLNFDDLGNNVKNNLSINFLMSLISDNKYHNLIKDCLEIKYNNNIKFLSRNIDMENLMLLNIEKDSALMKYILDHYFVNMATDISTKEIYDNNFIKNIYTLDELEHIYPSLQKSFLEFDDNELWGNEMLQTLVKLARIEKNKSIGFDITSFCEYFSSLDSKAIFQGKNIIPEIFLEKMYQSCKSQNIELFFDHSKFYISAVNLTVKNLSLQLLPFYLKKLNEGDNVNKSIEPLDRLQFICTLLKNIKRSNKYNNLNDIEIKNYYKIILEIEKGIYQYSLNVFEILQLNPLKFEETVKVKDFIKMIDSETRVILLSSLIQKIKNPNLLWVVKELEKPSYKGDYVFNEPIQKYIDMGFSKKQLISPITDLYPNMEKEVGDMAREKRQVIIDYVDRQDLATLAISKISIHSKEMKDNQKLWNIFIDLKNKVLDGDEPKFNNDSIYSTHYIENNLTVDLIEHLNKYHGGYLQQWYKDRSGFIDSDKVEKLMDIELVLTNKKLYPIAQILEDFLHNIIKRAPSLYIHLNNHLFIQNNSQIYQKIFNINYEIIFKNILSAENDLEKDSFLTTMSHDYIVNNFNMVLQQEDLTNFNYLLKKMSIEDFVVGFNSCGYSLQRKVFLENGLNFYILSTKNSSGINYLKLNTQTHEEFCEAVVFLKEMEKEKFIKYECNNSDISINYFEFQAFWEHDNVLKYIMIPNTTESVDFIIKEFPLSMYKKDDSSYVTTLSDKQFVQLIDNVNRVFDNDNGLEIYNNITTGNYFYHLIFNKISSNDLYIIESKFLNLLDTMNSLKNKPFHYMSLFNELQTPIGEKLGVIYDSFQREWSIIPNDCHFLKEFQSMLKLDNNPKYSHWSESEYFSHHFFNIFVDKDIYFQGLNEYLYNISTDNKSFNAPNNIGFNNKITFPFLYENYDKTYEDVNYYTECRKTELKTKFINNLPSFYFNNSTFFNVETLKNSESEDIFLEKICDEITHDNIWMILTTFGMTEKEYGRLNNMQTSKILGLILDNPNITMECLKKFEAVYKIMKECYFLLASNNADNLREKEIDYLRSMENRYFKMSNLEPGELEIIISEKMMNLEIVKHHITDKSKLKKF